MTHGTLGAYTNHRCRCADCRWAMARWAQKRRESGLCGHCGRSATIGTLCDEHFTIQKAYDRRRYLKRKGVSA